MRAEEDQVGVDLDQRDEDVNYGLFFLRFQVKNPFLSHFNDDDSKCIFDDNILTILDCKIFHFILILLHFLVVKVLNH